MQWTPEATETLRRLYSAGKSDAEIAKVVGCESGEQVRCRRRRIGLTESTESRKEAARINRRQQDIATLRQAVESVPEDVVALKNRVRELEAQVAANNARRQFETHCETPSDSGGKMTLRFSDHHYADENHLLSCAASLAAKFIVLVERYKPDRIAIAGGDDWIAGRGIFREQDLSLAVSDTDAQLQVGAVKWFRFLSAIRAVTEAPIEVDVLEGNHEYGPGKTRLGPALFDKTVLFCQPLPNISWRQHRHRAIINLASEGHHNALVYHGYGHSSQSPNSPGFVGGAKDDIITLQQRLPPEQHIRRVLSGHTHWSSCDLERIRGIAFDTTGGLQRNDRVQLHKSSRPVGWIVYVSPRGSSEIQTPIKLQPELETHERELADPHLCSANRADCAECVTFYEKTMSERGMLSLSDPLGTTGGRW